MLSVDHYLRQVTALSDSQLMQELKKNKVDVGPITSTTRRVYEKKLAKLLAEKAKGTFFNIIIIIMESYGQVFLTRRCV